MAKSIFGADPAVLAEARAALTPLAPLAREPLRTLAPQLLLGAAQGTLAAVLAGASRL